jgi:hypothetical protein
MEAAKKTGSFFGLVFTPFFSRCIQNIAGGSAQLSSVLSGATAAVATTTL